MYQTRFGLKKVTIDNQGSESFRPDDIRKALIKYGGPLIFAGAFVRMFKKRFYKYGHVILVYGTTHGSVFYHDPGLGLNLCTASQELKWNEFKNAWNERGLDVYAVRYFPGTSLEIL